MDICKTLLSQTIPCPVHYAYSFGKCIFNVMNMLGPVELLIDYNPEILKTISSL